MNLAHTPEAFQEFQDFCDRFGEAVAAHIIAGNDLEQHLEACSGNEVKYTTYMFWLAMKAGV